MLATYQTLFTDRCAACERILSQEGYEPAIARVWREQEAADGVSSGAWQARHVTCL
ncbi:hypothetical protein OF83DRAFT_1051875 [Amylostereum chailletii]|nr:hypothetical protein OF83DRAFT_1051875 [Amylostereum chailletii]